MYYYYIEIVNFYYVINCGKVQDIYISIQSCSFLNFSNPESKNQFECNIEIYSETLQNAMICNELEEVLKG